VRALRDLAADEFAKREGELQGPISVNIDAYEKAVERLVSAHTNIASGTDLVIGSDTRWSAIWELSGRCLSECRLLIHALRGGFALEASSNVRAMFEAMYLLAHDLPSAVSDPSEVAPRRWRVGPGARLRAPGILRGVRASRPRRTSVAGLMR
jgi:hypothetical protein